jgi:meso-butanediol dehydrogenase / (S,S)-butanediol dehydrogenase / diacetyl reductase
MGRCIVITGAGSGLGRALAHQFAARGDAVVLLGRTLAKLEAVARELGAASYPLACDVADPESVRTAFAALKAKHGSIDVLINNAAVYEAVEFEQLTDQHIATAMTINFAGPIYCSRAAIPLMQRGSHIINISSETVGMNHAMFAMYQSSKAGLERFTEALHADVEAHGIRVTLVRAGQMMGEDSRAPTDPAAAMHFAEANLQRGLNLRSRPISPFTAVAATLNFLLDLPPEVNVPWMQVEARRP